MTILTAVFVPEGIVLAADSRVTSTLHFSDGSKHQSVERDNEFKVSLFRKKNIGISYHGSTHINSKPVPGLLSEFYDTQLSDRDNVEDVSRKLQQILLDNQGSNVCFIVAGYDDGIPSVFVVCEDSYIRKNYDNNSILYGVHWRGDYKEVDKCFSNIKINFEVLSLKEAIQFAELIVETAMEREVNNGHHPCGGPVDVLVVTKDIAEFHKIKTIEDLTNK